MVRTERAASQNFNDHSSAEAVATGVLNRIIAEHAVPEVDGKPLAPSLLTAPARMPLAFLLPARG